MAQDTLEMIQKFKELNEKKKNKEEYEKKRKETEIENNLNSAFSRLKETLSDGKLFGLLQVYWVLDENGTTYESGGKEVKRYFDEIQEYRLLDHENRIYFHPYYDENKADIKMCEYQKVYYQVNNGLYADTVNTLMRLEYDEDGDYKLNFNAHYKQWNEDEEKWHSLRDDENTKKIKTEMINHFCESLPEFMEEVESTFNELMHDQELQYGDEDELKEVRLEDFAKAYELYFERMEEYPESFSADGLKEKGEVHLWELVEHNIVYEVNYDVNDEKLRYYKRGELLKEETYTIAEATQELMKGYEKGVGTTYIWDGLVDAISDDLRFIDTCSKFFETDEDEYLWNEERTRLYYCNKSLNEDEKALLLKNADEKSIRNEFGNVFIAYDEYEDAEEVLFNLVKDNESVTTWESKNYQRMLERLNQGVRMM